MLLSPLFHLRTTLLCPPCPLKISKTITAGQKVQPDFTSLLCKMILVCKKRLILIFFSIDGPGPNSKEKMDLCGTQPGVCENVNRSAVWQRYHISPTFFGLFKGYFPSPAAPPALPAQPSRGWWATICFFTLLTILRGTTTHLSQTSFNHPSYLCKSTEW